MFFEFSLFWHNIIFNFMVIQFPSRIPKKIKIFMIVNDHKIYKPISKYQPFTKSLYVEML